MLAVDGAGGLSGDPLLDAGFTEGVFADWDLWIVDWY